MTIKTAEAAVVREAASRVLAGDSLRSICLDFNRRDIPSAQKKEWQTPCLRRILVNPRIAGLSTYHGEPAGAGAWRGIISRPKGARLRALLLDPDGRRAGTITPYLLKGLLRCSRCGDRLKSARKAAGRVYASFRSPEANR